MPRPERPDVRPIIIIDDNRALEAAANAAMPKGKKVSVFDAGAYPHGQAQRMTAWLHEHLGWLRKAGIQINYELLVFLISQCPFAVAQDAAPRNLKVALPEGKRAVCLTQVGCRVRLTEEEIAKAVNLCRTTVSEHIALMKEQGIIVNWGKGWLEFAAIYVWNGKESLRLAYAEQQPCHPSQSLVFYD